MSMFSVMLDKNVPVTFGCVDTSGSQTVVRVPLVVCEGFSDGT